MATAAARAMNDDEVYSEMKKMVAFIKQEALEKAREIKVKADEEFSIEKAKLVRQESVNIEAAAQRRLKQAEIERKIAQSTQINKSRLKVLQARDQMIADLFDVACDRLRTIAQDKNRYKAFLRNSMVQSFLQLMEDEVVVECRKADVKLVEQMLTEAQAKYLEMVGKPVKATVDKQDYLNEAGAGGVVVTALFGRIRCANTLESRLELVSEQMLPEIRVMLFGHSPSRRFFN